MLFMFMLALVPSLVAAVNCTDCWSGKYAPDPTCCTECPSQCPSKACCYNEGAGGYKCYAPDLGQKCCDTGNNDNIVCGSDAQCPSLGGCEGRTNSTSMTCTQCPPDTSLTADHCQCVATCPAGESKCSFYPTGGPSVCCNDTSQVCGFEFKGQHCCDKPKTKTCGYSGMCYNPHEEVCCNGVQGTLCDVQDSVCCRTAEYNPGVCCPLSQGGCSKTTPGACSSASIFG
mmetsp:Transcript_6242/g.11833  ORF Transcript_6242/g.11833 Transcript_6242/m.11833 type:complete len:229 (+) Transcript_6242:93-779(+)